MSIIKPLSTSLDIKKIAEQVAQNHSTQSQQTYGYPTYQKSDAVKQAEALLQQHEASKPSAYNSKYQQQINDIALQLINRQPFQYDVNGDALYQQYKDRYIHNGQRAMQDTMGQAAALTGGYGSSYAQSVGQQAYNEYMMGLNDVIPELQQLALDKYDRETARLQDQYALYSDLDTQDYSRWQDSQNAYYTELDRLTQNARYEAEQDYGKYESGYQVYQKSVEEAMKAAQEAAEQAEEEEPYKLEKYKFAGVDDDGQYRYYKGDKQVTYAQGINPHTGTVNPDVKYGTFGESGYQPKYITINGKGTPQPLTKTGKTAEINGHEQNIWMTPDGSFWMWDDTVNRYVEYDNYVEVDTAATKKFIGGLYDKSQFKGRTQGKYASYNEYVEATIDQWLAEGKLNEAEAATLMVRYGLY